MEPRALGSFTLFTDGLADAGEFPRHLLVGGDDVIECVGNLSVQACPVTRKAYREIPVSHGLEAGEYHAEVGRSTPAVTHPVPILFLLFKGGLWICFCC